MNPVYFFWGKAWFDIIDKDVVMKHSIHLGCNQTNLNQPSLFKNFFLDLLKLPRNSIIITPMSSFWLPGFLNFVGLKRFKIINILCEPTFTPLIDKQLFKNTYCFIRKLLNFFERYVVYHIYCTELIKQAAISKGIYPDKFIKFQEFFHNGKRIISTTTITNKQKNFLFIGNKYPHNPKRLDLLIGAFQVFQKEYRDSRLTILGLFWENYYSKIEMARFQEDSNIFFEGFQKDVGKYYQNHSFLILPSEYEGFGIVTLEAVDGGLLPAVSSLTGSKEFVGDIDEKLVFSLSQENILSTLKYLYNLSYREFEERLSVGRQLLHSKYNNKIASEIFSGAIEKAINGCLAKN